MNRTDKSRIFISYSHRGNGLRWKSLLLDALYVFGRYHLLDVWEDGKIRVGSNWNDDIEQAMASARLAVVLLTKEALESEYIQNKEFPFLREQQQSGKLSVFPVICETCNWQDHDWLVAIQSTNSSSPLSGLSQAAQVRVFRKLATDIAEELSRAAFIELPKHEQHPIPDRLYLDKFPLTHGNGLMKKLIGREQELALLDLAFAQQYTAIISLVAWGGVGKTALVKHWLRRLQRKGEFDGRRVYTWNFYSQGTNEDRHTSEDAFLTHALNWFGVLCDPTLTPRAKGRLLAESIARESTLLVLDGIESLQYPPGPMGGQLRARGVQSLLEQLASKSKATAHRSLCLVTTREPLTDFTDFEHHPNAAWGSILRVDLGNLTEESGAALLHHTGAKRVGAVEIKADDTELLDASREIGGHALTLNLLGRFLARGYNGDIRRRDLVKFEEADHKEQGGTTFKMLTAFENWFANSGEFSARQLSALRILGLFDRPADTGCISALLKPPIIAGLTDLMFTESRRPDTSSATLQPLLGEDWNMTVSFLADFGLLDIQSNFDSQTPLLDCHPLIREYFAKKIRDKAPEAWRAAHKRLYDYLKNKAELRPSTLSGLEPLYQAIAHGCQALMHQQVYEEVYFPRILRGAEHFSWHQHAAFGSEISAQSYFFDKPWSQPAAALSEPTQAWILNEVSFCLRALGRLTEAVEPLRISVKMNEAQDRWIDAAICAGNLSELQLTLGEVNSAMWIADRCVTFSDRSGYEFYKRRNRTILGQAFHCAGFQDKAQKVFREAEVMQSESEPFPLLYSLLGARYCDLILAASERAAWQQSFGPCDRTEKSVINACQHVKWRAYKMFEVREQEDSLLEIAFDHLTLGRAALYESVLDTSASNARQTAIKHLMIAVDVFHRAGQQEFECLSLLSRAWLYFLEGNRLTGIADLDEAWQIAERGTMRLLMADIYLHRARLFCSKNELKHARAMIERCGYWRRKEELEDAESAAAAWLDI